VNNSLFIRLLIIASLLLAQLGGMMHGISHVLTERVQAWSQSQLGDQSLSHEKHCNLCDAYAQIINVIGSSIVSFTPCMNFCGTEQGRSYSCLFLASVPFAARAPPYSA
jgi:hypothetical protein